MDKALAPRILKREHQDCHAGDIIRKKRQLTDRNRQKLPVFYCHCYRSRLANSGFSKNFGQETGFGAKCS
jgi:hypothetical protein